MSKNNTFYRDYAPMRILDSIKSTDVKGVIVKLRLKKVTNYTIIERIVMFITFSLVKKVADIYYWLPYKDVVVNNDKYSIVGGKSRDPFGMQWYEVKGDSDIYKSASLKDYNTEVKSLEITFRKIRTKNPVRLLLPFTTEELTALHSKRVIRALDKFIYHNVEVFY